MNYESIIKLVWTQEGIGFITLLFTICMFGITYYKQELANLKEVQKNNASKKIELWLKFQEQMNSFINKIDERYDVLVQESEDIKIICKKDISSLVRGEDDNIIHTANTIVRNFARLYSLKNQYLSMYEHIDNDKELLNVVEKTWESDIMPYYYFYFDNNKRPLFYSALQKGLQLENYPQDFANFVDTIVDENNQSINNNSNTLKKIG